MSATTGTPTPDAARRIRPVLAWAPSALLVWAALYGTLRALWAVGDIPGFGFTPDELLFFTGWGGVGLCVAAAAVTLAMLAVERSRVVLVASWAVVAAMAASIPVVLPDLVAFLLLGLGVPFDFAAAGGRGGMLVGAGLLAVLTLIYQRRLRGSCLRCGRTEAYTRAERPPIWAWWAAYLAVAGCLIRQWAQLAWDSIPTVSTPTSSCSPSKACSCWPVSCCRWRWSTAGV